MRVQWVSFMNYSKYFSLIISSRLNVYYSLHFDLIKKFLSIWRLFYYKGCVALLDKTTCQIVCGVCPFGKTHILS